MKTAIRFGLMGILATCIALPTVPSAIADSDAPLMRVNISAYRNFTSSDLTRTKAAVELLERVLNSEDFRQAILNYWWGGENHFANNDGMTNAQVLETILNGAEVLNGIVDHTADLDLTMYRSSWFGRNVVGYTYSDTPRLWLNRRVQQYFTPAEVAGNLAHEWCHKLGFDHDYSRTSKRPYSVPYAVGDMVIEIAERMSE